jgi:hypothetical protein
MPRPLPQAPDSPEGITPSSDGDGLTSAESAQQTCGCLLGRGDQRTVSFQLLCTMQEPVEATGREVTLNADVRQC